MGKKMIIAAAVEQDPREEEEEEEEKMGSVDDGAMMLLQHLRSRATEHLIREDWDQSVQVYSQFISLCTARLSDPDPNPNNRAEDLRKYLCLAFSNRAEARSRLRRYSQALQDCDSALGMDRLHSKTLICKGKILLSLSRYSAALQCFKSALPLDPRSSHDHLERCRKLEAQARTGAFDLSDWVSHRFSGKAPELAEYVGAVRVQRSEISGRGLFATKNLDAGTLVLATEAVAVERAILPEYNSSINSGERVRLVMWKNFADRVAASSAVCPRTRRLIRTLSTGGDDEAGLEVPDMNLFRAESDEEEEEEKSDEQQQQKKKKKKKVADHDETVGREEVLGRLDVNLLVEGSHSGKVLGKNRGYYGVGLWVLPAFVNHSCAPNARRVHVGDHVLVHASRDIKAGEELTFAYFDVLSPLSKRQKMSRDWGFHCHCRRCSFEKEISAKPGMREIEVGFERGLLDAGSMVYGIEEGMRKWMVKGKERGYLRASFWVAFSEVYLSEKPDKRWVRWVPAIEAAVDSVADAVGGDERVVKVFMEGVKRRRGGEGCLVEMERVMKLGRGVYGKVVKKKQAMRTLLEWH